MRFKWMVSLFGVMGLVGFIGATTVADAALPSGPKYTLTRADYGKSFGTAPSAADMNVIGVNIGTPVSAVIKSLGKPTSWENQKHGLSAIIRYGGIAFGLIGRGNNATVANIVLTNRDATTARGVAVGDSLEKVYEVYGTPDFIIKEKQAWIYGSLDHPSGNRTGITFGYNDNNRVTDIVIENTDVTGDLW